MLLFFSEKGELWRKTCEISKCLNLTSSHILKRKCIVEEKKLSPENKIPDSQHLHVAHPQPGHLGLDFDIRKKTTWGVIWWCQTSFELLMIYAVLLNFSCAKWQQEEKNGVPINISFSSSWSPNQQGSRLGQIPNCSPIRNFQQRNPLLWTESKRAGIVNDLLSLFNAHYMIFWFSLYNILILFTNTWIDYAFKSTV